MGREKEVTEGKKWQREIRDRGKEGTERKKG